MVSIPISNTYNKYIMHSALVWQKKKKNSTFSIARMTHKFSLIANRLDCSLKSPNAEMLRAVGICMPIIV